MITSLYSGILGLLFFKISIDTIQARGKEKVSLGVGEKNQIMHIVQHISALAFTFGRMLHYLSMKNKEVTFKKRKLGMQLTLFPLIAFSCINIGIFLSHALIK